ncbi:zinc finger protein 436 [Aedes aegypti]|uniref:Zinc finger protein n=2 Tax=Aedes aegypti TaxID=7159 RepID=A0A1S4FK94_AEDAE|nr:zinc finger protein 436 [Aedes aegypti]
MEVPLNVDRICRTCLSETESLICMFDDDIQQSGSISSMISACSNMKIKRNDGLPDKICQKCLQLARNSFAFKQQCDIAYRTLRSLAEQYNLTVATSGNDPEDTSRGTQTDPEVECCEHLCAVNSKSSESLESGPKEHHERKDEDSEILIEVECTPEVADSVESNFDAIHDDSCKLEAFESVEYLSETFDEAGHQIKDEPNVEEEMSNLEADFSNDQVDFLELEYEIEEEKPKTKKIVRTRKLVKSSPGVHKCEYCAKEFRRGTHLRRHILIHTQEKHFKCKLCGKAFSRSDHLTIHESTFHSKERPFGCQLCEKSFKRSEHLRNHMETKHSGTVKTKKQEFCKICNKGFTSTKSLESHIKAHAEPKTFKCCFCGEQFSNRTDHGLHVRQLHQEGKSFLCSECGQSFLRNDYLLVHMRRHKGIKPYKCKFCPKAFPRATDLRVHEKYHTNEKTHLCTICGKGFHRAYNLVVHSRTHNGLKPYQCPHCPKSFAQGNDLKAHVRRHTGERYRCDICNEGFIQCYQLTNHKRTVHNIDTAGNTRRVVKYLTPSAQEQQVFLQKQQQQLEQLLEEQKALELQQQQAGWDIEHEEHDPNLDKKILETKDQIQQIERQLTDINNRLHEEVERYKQSQAEDCHSTEHNRSANSSFGQDFLNDSTSEMQHIATVKDEKLS